MLSGSQGQPGAAEGVSSRAEAEGRRRTSILSLVLFDVGGPLVVYYGLRSSGSSTVTSLVLSGVPPAMGIALGAWRHRRVDAIGVVVLIGIIVGAVVGLASGSARLVLFDGTVPTAVLGVVCFGSLLTPRPLMYGMALQFIGPDSTQGREFQGMWQYREFRRIFIVITVVWGTAFLVETAAQSAIIEWTSANTAKTTANLMPIAIAALVTGWTVVYGKRQRMRGETAATARRTEALHSVDP